MRGRAVVLIQSELQLKTSYANSIPSHQRQEHLSKVCIISFSVELLYKCQINIDARTKSGLVLIENSLSSSSRC